MAKDTVKLPKEGDVIENYQGRFAKVLSATETRFGLSAWVAKKDDAEKETKAVRFLNTFGLSQVLKGDGDATFVAAETAPEAPAEAVAEEKPKKAKK